MCPDYFCFSVLRYLKSLRFQQLARWDLPTWHSSLGYSTKRRSFTTTYCHLCSAEFFPCSKTRGANGQVPVIVKHSWNGKYHMENTDTPSIPQPFILIIKSEKLNGLMSCARLCTSVCEHFYARIKFIDKQDCHKRNSIDRNTQVHICFIENRVCWLVFIPQTGGES